MCQCVDSNSFCKLFFWIQILWIFSVVPRLMIKCLNLDQDTVKWPENMSPDFQVGKFALSVDNYVRCIGQ